MLCNVLSSATAECRQLHWLESRAPKARQLQEEKLEPSPQEIKGYLCVIIAVWQVPQSFCFDIGFSLWGKVERRAMNPILYVEIHVLQFKMCNPYTWVELRNNVDDIGWGYPHDSQCQYQSQTNNSADSHSLAMSLSPDSDRSQSHTQHLGSTTTRNPQANTHRRAEKEVLSSCGKGKPQHQAGHPINPQPIPPQLPVNVPQHLRQMLLLSTTLSAHKWVMEDGWNETLHSCGEAIYEKVADPGPHEFCYDTPSPMQIARRCHAPLAQGSLERQRGTQFPKKVILQSEYTF